MRRLVVFLLPFMLAAPAQAGDLSVTMNLVSSDGVEKPIGTVTIAESAHGLVFTPDLKGLKPGLHGFHVHEHPSCAPKLKDGKKVPALAAGGHYDPGKTGRHGTAWGDGHLGDLPGLFVAANGDASYPVLAPRLKLKDVRGRSLIIHEGGDNHADHPAPLGGGGARVACGLIVK